MLEKLISRYWAGASKAPARFLFKQAAFSAAVLLCLSQIAFGAEPRNAAPSAPAATAPKAPSAGAAPIALADLVATPCLQRYRRALWNDARAEQHQSTAGSESELLRGIRKDILFDAFLAAKARENHLELDGGAKTEMARQVGYIETNAAMTALAEKLHPSPSQVRKIAEEEEWNKKNPEKWEVYYIFLDDTTAKNDAGRAAVRNKALALRSEVTTETFRTYAQMWSDAPSCDKGGALGSMTLDEMGPTFREHVKKTPPGTIGGPYRTPSGWNIIYVLSHQSAGVKQAAMQDQERLAARKIAWDEVRAAQKEPAKWKAMLDDLQIAQNRDIQIEMAALENFLLGRTYIISQAPAKEPTLDELRAIFNSLPEKPLRTPRRKAREILVTSDKWTTDSTKAGWIARRAVRDRARAIRKQILSGEEFADFARNYSSAQSASSGGELGWVTKPSNYALDTALDNLKIGEISPPIATSKGYWIVQLLEIEKPKPLDFDEARDGCLRIWRKNQTKELTARLAREFEAWKERARIR